MEGGGNCGDARYRGIGGYVGSLPPAPELMVLGQKDVEHDPGGEVGEVPYGLHPGDGSLSILECVCPGPQA